MTLIDYADDRERAYTPPAQQLAKFCGKQQLECLGLIRSKLFSVARVLALPYSELIQGTGSDELFCYPHILPQSLKRPFYG